ncbi:hypothetical protein FOCC_FOCC004341 [Frankliniella occidentalis]|nr:hypothetical protein FOCC_FOCC004341 [Frankliniella occidentalis]
MCGPCPNHPAPSSPSATPANPWLRWRPRFFRSPPCCVVSVLQSLDRCVFCVLTASMWRMAGAPGAAPWTGWPPRRRRGSCCRTFPSGESPSSTAPTRTSKCRRSPCRETRPSPARG